MSKFCVTVQYRSVRTVIVEAKDSQSAVEKAAKRIERSGREFIAAHVSQLVPGDE